MTRRRGARLSRTTFRTTGTDAIIIKTNKEHPPLSTKDILIYSYPQPAHWAVGFSFPFFLVLLRLIVNGQFSVMIESRFHRTMGTMVTLSHILSVRQFRTIIISKHVQRAVSVHQKFSMYVTFLVAECPGTCSTTLPLERATKVLSSS